NQSTRDIIRTGLQEQLDKIDVRVSAIVLKDLNKGVVTDHLIRLLSQKFPKADWYLSSKQWRPAWLDSIPPGNVKLFLVPQLAAESAIQVDGVNQVASSSWLTVGKSASHEAMIAIDKLCERFNNAHIVVLPRGMQVVARESKECDGVKRSKENWYVQDN